MFTLKFTINYHWFIIAMLNLRIKSNLIIPITPSDLDAI